MLKDKGYAGQMVQAVYRMLLAGNNSAEMKSENRQITVKGCWTEFAMLIEVLGVERVGTPIETQNTTTQKPQNEGY